MAIPVDCECGKQFSVADSKAGREIACPRCGLKFPAPHIMVSTHVVTQGPTIAAIEGWGNFFGCLFGLIKLTLVLVGIAIVIGVVMAAFGVGQRPQEMPEAGPPIQVGPVGPSIKFPVGSKVILDRPGDPRHVPFKLDKGAGDVRIVSGTLANVIEVRGDSRRVRIAEGYYAGKEGSVAIQDIRP